MEVTETLPINHTTSNAAGTYTFTTPGGVGSALLLSVRDYDAYRAMSTDDVRLMLARITGRVKTLIDAVIPNETQAKATKDQAHLAIWTDFKDIQRFAHEFYDEERKQTPNTGSSWRPRFPLAGDETK